MRASLNHALLDISVDAVVGMDEEGLVVEFNPAAEELFGYAREDTIGKRLGALIVPPHLREAHEQGFRRYLETGVSSVLGRRVRLPAMRADGSSVSVELSIARVEHDPPLFVGFIRDLTAAEAAEAELKAAEERYRSLVEQLPLVTYVTSAGDRPATIYLSPQAEELAGYPLDRWFGDDNTFYESILHPDDRERVDAEFSKFRAAGEPFRYEYRLIHADGSTVWVIDQTTPIYGENGTHLYSQGFLLNVTERKNLEEKILAQSRHEAMTDALTGLGNRRRLSADLAAHLGDLDPARPLMLTLFDLDGFKQYNDTFGHPAGDQLLERLSARLAAVLEGRGTAYRMGGDEFCALWNLSDIGQASVTTVEAVAALSEHGESFSIACSYGSVLLPNEATGATEALRVADRRMYIRKGSASPSAARQSSDVLHMALAESNSELSTHLGGVAELTCATAARLGVREEDMEAARQTGLLHDVGKFAIPDEILHKSGPLDDAEWEFMKRHTVIGERIISAAPALAVVARFVRSTHEHYDGGGYPDGLAGDAIPLISRIVAVCDAYDAMVTEPHVLRSARGVGGDRRAAQVRRHAVRSRGRRGADRRAREHGQPEAPGRAGRLGGATHGASRATDRPPTRIREERLVEESDHAPLVLGRMRVDAARVLGARHLPHPLRLAGGGEVLRLPLGLAAHAGIGVDEEDGTRGDLGDAVDDRRRRAVVREDAVGGRHRRSDRREEHVLPAFDLGRADRETGALGDDRLEHGRLRGGHEQDLAADRGAEAADAVRVDVRAGLEVLGAGDQIAVAGPANEVALASTLSARVEQQHAVAVAREHPRLLDGRAAWEHDHCPSVARGDVQRGQLDAVARGDLHVLVGKAERRGRAGAADVRIAVREADREDEEDDRRDDRHHGDAGAQGAAQIAAAPAAAGAARLPERHRCREDQNESGQDGEQPGVVVARGAPVHDVVETRNAEGDADRTGGHRRGGAQPGTQARIERRDRGEDRHGNEAAREVVERRRPGRGLQVVVVDDVQADRTEREHDDPVLGAGKGGCARDARAEVSDRLHAPTVAAEPSTREGAFRPARES